VPSVVGKKKEDNEPQKSQKSTEGRRQFRKMNYKILVNQLNFNIAGYVVHKLFDNCQWKE